MTDIGEQGGGVEGDIANTKEEIEEMLLEMKEEAEDIAAAETEGLDIQTMG